MTKRPARFAKYGRSKNFYFSENQIEALYEKILLINTHQFYEGFAEGKLNKTMADVITEEMKAKGCEVKLTYIEKGYDINEEVEKHL
ncbi:hypothetical protein QUF74_19275 [Candidatus Halobeggiatoa sp. HSG11]|nr:hypothetical protein [Candidatus Halobeggiatoa sp. HSG11]